MGYMAVAIGREDYDNLKVMAEAYNQGVDSLAGDAVWNYIVDQAVHSYLLVKCATANDTVDDFSLTRAQRLISVIPYFSKPVQCYIGKRALALGYISEEKQGNSTPPTTP